MAKICPITVEALPVYSGLDGDNADNYYRAGQRNGLLSSEVIAPFSGALKGYTGYDDDNIPDRETEVACDLGDMRFLMKVTPTKKRPGYREVYDGLRGHLHATLSEYEAGKRPVGVITIEGEPYISAHDVLGRLSDARNTVTSEGVKIEIAESPEMPDGVDSVVLPLGMDMSSLNEGNATRYMESLRLSEDYGAIISGFEDELIGLTGYDNDHPPGETEHMFRHIGGHVFHVKSIPYDSTSWGKVVSGLDKQPPKKKVENGGDLVLLTNDIHIPRLEAYRMRKREGNHMVSLKGLLQRMDELVDENTSTKVRQKPITHYPIV
ncbi:MAG: hypothetical protein DRO99_02390 [Candidatus Aenigmatarchaeota archaeon]|nr:MAG: hypothetical protein DRO99_02390 [Candidatus Aenigmarchaeota archaeon]